LSYLPEEKSNFQLEQQSKENFDKNAQESTSASDDSFVNNRLLIDLVC
jgi:hypothetical protein